MVKHTKSIGIILKSLNTKVRRCEMKFNTALLHDSFTGDKETGATLVPVYNVNAYAHGIG